MFKIFVSYDLLLIIVNLIVYIKKRERERENISKISF